MTNKLMNLLAVRVCSFMLLCGFLALFSAEIASARFLSPDTWDPWLVGVDTNRYAYSNNDPINGSDPNGHGCLCGPPAGFHQDLMNMSPEERSQVEAQASGTAIGLGAMIATGGIGIEFIGSMTGASAIMSTTEILAGEIGIAAPVATGAATIVGGQLAYGGKVFSLTEHHLYPQGATWAPLAKQLGLNVESAINKVMAYQNGFAKSHVNFTDNIVQEARQIVATYGPNPSPQKAAAVKALLEKYADILKKDPAALVRTKKDLSNPAPKSPGTAGSGLPANSGQAVAGAPSSREQGGGRSCGNWVGGC